MYNESQIFIDRNVLSIEWMPNKDLIVHRDKEMEKIAFMLQPIFKNSKPFNCFIYGSSGTGKTLLIRTIMTDLEELRDRGKLKTKFVSAYIKCSECVTPFNFLLKMSTTLNLGYKGPRSYLYYDKLKEFLKKTKLILIMDEIDKMKNSNVLVFNLSRCDDLSIIGIASNLRVTEEFDSATISSLQEKKILITKYDAPQLRDILKKRANLAFNINTMGPGVIEKCAALSAQEHGDARRALDLLKTAGDVAEQEESKKIFISHVDRAEETIDVDIISEKIKTLTRQAMIIFVSILKLHNDGEKEIQTGDVFIQYETICTESGIRILTQRRISDLINEMDDDGIITARINYKGRYGRTKDISLPNFSPMMMEKIKEALGPYADYINGRKK